MMSMSSSSPPSVVRDGMEGTASVVSPTINHRMSVNQLCESLWNCQDPNQVLDCLDAICSAIYNKSPILRHPDHAYYYDPSETFLAVQGAALRSLRSDISDENAEEDADAEEDERKNSITREIVYKSLLAAAALARCCVGPAWWNQIYQRREEMRLQHHQLTSSSTRSNTAVALDDSSLSMTTTLYEGTAASPEPPPHFIHASTTNTNTAEQDDWACSIRSYSPMTQQSSPFAPTTPIPYYDTNVVYPYIPEVLVAAMLRFAASLTTDANKAKYYSSSATTSSSTTLLLLVHQAQMVLVQSLCCRPDPHDAPEWVEQQAVASTMADATDDDAVVPCYYHSINNEWLIPNVSNEIGSMVLAWLQLAATTTTTATGKNSREQESSPASFCVLSLRLAVTRACNDLVSTGWCPPNKDVCSQMIDMLLTIAQDASASDLQEEEPQQQQHQQKQVLLASSGSTEAVSTLATLVSQHDGLIPVGCVPAIVSTVTRLYMQVGYTTSSSQTTTAHTATATASAAAAEEKRVRKALKTQRDSCFFDVSELLWTLLSSNSLAMVAVESLLSMIVDATKYYASDIEDADLRWGMTETAACKQSQGAIRVLRNALWGDPPESLSIPLLRSYWLPVLELLLDSLSACYIAWERAEPGEASRACTSILCDVASEMLMALCKCIENEIRGGSARLLCVEWESIVAELETSIIPWLRWPVVNCQWPIAGSPTRAESLVMLLGEFLDHSSSFESFPFVNYGLLERMCLILLQQAVPCLDETQASLLGSTTVRSWSRLGLFPHRLVDGWSETATSILSEAFRKLDTGEYAHDPTVRLEAVKSMTADASTVGRGAQDGENETESEQGTNIESVPSLLELTQHMREQHLDFVRCSIFPILTDVLLSRSSDSLAYADDICCTEESAVPAQESSHSSRRKFADILGSRVQISSSSRWPTIALALYTIQLTGRLYTVSGDRESRVLFVDVLRSVALNKRQHSFPVRVAAVTELERCLESTFVSLPHAHASVPSIINALCAVLDAYTAYAEVGGPDFSPETVLAVAALDPLTRLRVASDRHVTYRKRDITLTNSSDLLYSFYKTATKKFRSSAMETSGSPTLEVRGEQKYGRETTLATVISFDGIVASVLKYLQLTASSEIQHAPALSFTLKCLRIHCFDVLRHQFLSSVPIRIPERIARAVFSRGYSHGETDEVLARGLALIPYAQNELLECRKSDDDAPQRSDLAHISNLVELVLELYESPRLDERDVGCRAISSMLPSLSCLDRTHGTCTMDQVCSSLRRRIDVFRHYPSRDAYSFTRSDCRSLLSVILDILLISPRCKIQRDLIPKLFQFCTDVVMERYCSPDSYCVQLSIRCVASVLDRMNVEELQHAKWTYQSNLGSTATINPSLAIAELIELMENQCCASVKSERNGSRGQATVTESFNMDNFQCDHSGAWLFDESILITCNIGARKTRSQGYLEVVTRSQTGRRRGLIRIPEQVSLEHPDFPPPLRASQKCPGDPRLVASENVGRVVPVKPSSEQIALKAADVLARFDMLMAPQSDEQNCDFKPEVVVEENHRGISQWLKNTVDLDDGALSVVYMELSSFLASSGISRPEEIISHLGEETGSLLTLKVSEQLNRAIAVLDRTPNSNTHKVALLYDQSADPSDAEVDLETRLLTTTRCSPSFWRFACGLGEVVQSFTLGPYSGGLDTSAYESDGKFALSWFDNDESTNARSTAASSSVVFHVVSLMPDGGPVSRLNRKRHVGNDFVLILFSDRGSDALVEFDHLGDDLLIGGAFGYVIIFVTVPRPGVCQVNVRVREDGGMMNDSLNVTLHTFVSDNTIAAEEAPAVVRNIAMRADLACRTGIGAADAPSNYLYRSELLHAMRRYEGL